jgi:hypothetical protein
MNRRTAIVVVALGLLCATGLKSLFNTFHSNEDDATEVFSATSREAERSGILISRLSVDAWEGVPQEATLRIDEAWIERCAVHRYSWIWIHRRVPARGFTLVIKLSQRVSPQVALWSPERGGSFGWIGGLYFRRHFEQLPDFPMVVSGALGKSLFPVLTLKRPNKSLEPTPTSVTPRADARVAPAVGVAHL